MHNKNFFKEIFIGTSDSPKVLCVYFARERADWEALFENDKPKFIEGARGKKLELIMASEKLEEFKQQLLHTDIVYVRGGDTEKLLEHIKKIPDFAERIKGKIYAGSSAGAYFVSKYYCSVSKREILRGLGILPIKTFAHYNDSERGLLQKLKEHGEPLEVYTIPDHEFVVIRK